MLNLLRFSLLLTVPVTLSYVITDQSNGYLNPGFSYWNPFGNYWNFQSPVVFASGMSEFPNELSQLTGKTGTQTTADIDSRYIPRFFSPGFAFEPRFHTNKIISAGTEFITHPPPKKGSEFKLNFELPKIFKSQQSEDTSVPGKLECDKLRGSYILGECYILVTQKQKFSLAMNDCRFKGGQIWTPDLTNPALFAAIAQAMPLFTSAPDFRVWLGASVINTRVKTVSGEDITDNLYVQINCNSAVLANDQCLTLNFQEGGLCTKGEACEIIMAAYVCEVPLKSNQQEVSVHKYIAG